MKIGNLGRLDPELKKKGIVGLSNGSKTEEEVWNEFKGNWEKLAYESELLIAKYENKSIEEIVKIDIDSIAFPKGLDKEAVIKRRVNQNFFRSTFLSSYNFKCAITGLTIPELFLKYNDQKIILPDKFLPAPEFLDYHYNNIFEK